MPESDRRLPAKDLGLLLAVCAVWGLNFIPIRWALDAIPPLALAGLRFLLAAVPAVLFVPRPRIAWPRLVAYGAAIGVFQFGLLFIGIRLGLAAGLASLLMQTQLFFTMALAAMFTGDRIRPPQLVGALVSAAGVAVLAADLLSQGAKGSAAGLACIGLASLAWATGNVVAKAASRESRFDMFGLVVWSSLVAPLPLAALSYAFEGGWVPFQAIATAGWKPWLSVLLMSGAATLFGYSAWNRLLQRHSAGLVGPFTMTIPLFGLAGAALVLGERLSALQFAGATIVLGGIAVTHVAGRWHSAPHPLSASREATPSTSMPTQRLP